MHEGGPEGRVSLAPQSITSGKVGAQAGPCGLSCKGVPGDGGLLPLQKVQGDGGEGQGQLWESFGRDYVGSSGLTPVIPPSGEEGVRSHQEARHPFPARSSPPPHPQAGGIALPQGWPRASGNVQRYDQQRRQWRPRSAPGRPTGSGFPAEETEATVFSSSGRVWSSRACGSHSAPPAGV